MKSSFKIRRRIVKLRRLIKLWPWIASIALHITVLAILSTIVFISFNIKERQKRIIPEAKLGKITAELPLFQRFEPKIKSIEERQLERQLKKSFSRANKKLSLRSNKRVNIIALQSKEAVKLPGCDLAKLEPAAPVTKFFSSTGNAYNIIYLVDRSASMIDTIEPLKRELKRSIDRLEPMQKFQIIFFSAGKPIEGPANGLTWATTRNKQIYHKFIDSIDAKGQTDPRWALQRALQLKPDLIYLLTDGIFSEEIAQKIIKWAKANKVKINTIAYLREIGATRLMEIAEKTGGVFRFVTEDQLE